MKLEMPVVETKRLLLRPVEWEDALDLFAIYHDPLVMLGNAVMSPMVDVEEMLEFMKATFLAYERWGLPQAMVLEELTTGCVIGICDYHTITGTTGELGYLLAQRYWHQGYMKEAIAAMLYIGFVHTGLSCIEAEYDANNVASKNVLHACGFGADKRQHTAILLNDGKYHSLMKCCIKKAEYDKKIGGKEDEERISTKI